MVSTFLLTVNRGPAACSVLLRSLLQQQQQQQQQQQRTITRSLRSSPFSSSSKRAKHALYMWGTDSQGSLLRPAEVGDSKKLDLPTAVNLLDHLLVKDDDDDVATTGGGDLTIDRIVCGPSDTAILLKDGRCLVCGENKNGQLGLGHNNPVPKLTAVELPAKKKIAQVSLGALAGAYVDTEGDLYTTGFGGSAFSGIGVLGQGEGNSCNTPLRVDSLVEDGCFVKQVQVGESHMTVLTTEGEVLTCGAGSYGRLGNLETEDQLYLDTVEILTKGTTQIAGGKSFTLALTDEGILYGWGKNDKGQLGTGLGLAVDMYAMQSVPEPIEANELFGRKVTFVAAGCSHAACITASGELFFWGMAQHLEPVRVDSILHTRVVDVACGQDYTLALGEDGKMYSFGSGRKGVLGQGSVKRSNQAALVGALEGKKISQLSAGWLHAACLVEEV